MNKPYEGGDFALRFTHWSEHLDVIKEDVMNIVDDAYEKIDALIEKTRNSP